MGRPRKPTALLELSGAFRRNPARRRDPAPICTRPLGDPPCRLPVEARAFWGEIVEACPAGVLGSSDRWAVELCARLMEKAVRVPDLAAVAELVKLLELSSDDARALFRREVISSSELSILRSLLAALGMTPADRSKLSVSIEKPKNKFADLANQANKVRRPN